MTEPVYKTPAPRPGVLLPIDHAPAARSRPTRGKRRLRVHVLMLETMIGGALAADCRPLEDERLESGP